MMSSTIMRKETPDSEAVASSEDERPWPSAPSFGTLPRNENGMPGIGGGIWSTQRHGSFKLEKAAHRNAVREDRLSVASQARGGLRADATPSPSASEGSSGFPFVIPLQPALKAGRSLSHSQGQREFIHATGLRPGSSEQNSAISLGLLKEEEADVETDSEFGGGLTQTTSHPLMGALQRTSTLPPTFDTFYGLSSSKDPPTGAGAAQTGMGFDRRFESALSNLCLDPPPRRAQWQSQLGWDHVPDFNESRRHSMADIPTRRGSLAGAEGRPSMNGGSFCPNSPLHDWQNEQYAHVEGDHRSLQQISEYKTNDRDTSASKEARNVTEPTSQLNYTIKTEQDQTRHIPNMYQARRLRISEQDHAEQDNSRIPPSMSTAMGQWNGGGGQGRPRRQIFIVSFKCSRVDPFFLIEGTGLTINEGDIVIVEADRGQDLGTVQHANVTTEDARSYKKKYGEEQYKWLMMFSKHNAPDNVNPNALQYRNEGRGAPSELIANAPASMQGSLPNNLRPKAIKRLANEREVLMLCEKEANEAKAKRACQQKVAHLGLQMEILDAEFQWDWGKLTFYYYADHYINFKDLITELYRIYKTRIWMSAVNPASFSQHAFGQPPSGVGPGAIGGFDAGNNNNSYAMAYGADPDPYGAVRPYGIGYDTYTPNYPGIPGVTNSFAPNTPTNVGGFQGYDRGGGTLSYNRDTSNEMTPRPYPSTVAFAPTPLYPHGYTPQSTTPFGGLAAASTAGMGHYGRYHTAATSTNTGFAGAGRTTTLQAPVGTRGPVNGNAAPTRAAPAGNAQMGGRFAAWGGANARADEMSRER